ncbi:gamma-glutamyltransferase [Kallotenue papyrolyticum]|uniref:gamma-glutamyltransferase n=1 Tax=Kallotenue papyrolyticum TaxID=1325125 RepID=UPI000492958A|nr:gamma-glutamyltransferase [Kallotenue papyrolyticum]
MQLDLTTLPYPGSRQPVLARRGVVATSQPLAAQAGLAMLQRGGNAVDAAIAAAVALTVVEPTSNGIGGDLFALVWDGAHLHGLNGSGRAPEALTLERVRQAGHTSMPTRGWLPVTVPGAPAAWRDLHRRFGRLRFSQLFEPAITYAEHGVPIAPVVATSWERAAQVFAANASAEFSGWADTFLINGRPPRAGELWQSRGHARALSLIAESYADDFYNGEIAQALVRFAQRTGGLLTARDLAQHHSTWVAPLSVRYRGYEVWELPPNGQGLAALIALNILEGFTIAQFERETPQSYHLQIEAMKLAFADAQRYIGDPEHVTVPTEQLLAKEYAARRRALIGAQALDPAPGDPIHGGTVYLCTADADGMMVSLIQSNYMGFGSGIVVPGLGIALHNRGAGFSLQPGHPNQLAPGKRPFHTIIPGFLTQDGRAVGPFGVMGGHMQPQGHLQMIVNTIDYGLNPQASLDAPRWYWSAGRDVLLEAGTPAALLEALQQRGHQARISEDRGVFGRGQIIWRLDNGVYVAGSDGRADGCAVGY